MGKIKQIDIKNRTYLFHHKRINLKDFDARFLKVDKKKLIQRLTSVTLVMLLLKKLLIARVLTV